MAEEDHAPDTVPMLESRVVVPFWFFDRDTLARRANLNDDDGAVWEIVTGEVPPPLRPPHDILTSWVALAYIGGIEAGGPILEPEVDRDGRLAIARSVLTLEQFLVVETIAVPDRYRRLPARELEDVIRNAESYLDRMWAACWLILTGWTDSEQCSIGEDVTDEFPSGELQDTVYAGFKREKNVADGDLLGEKRIGGTYEAQLVWHRLMVCEAHYRLNGPPPYEYVRDTIPAGPGWRQVVRLVPDRNPLADASPRET